MAWHRILVAMDFSPTARVALRSAEMLARRGEAGLVLAHVVEMPGGSYAYLEGVAYQEMRQDYVAEARRKMEATAERSRARGARIDAVEVRVGRPWTELLEIARHHEADLICLGNSGRSRFGRLLLGSTAENVVRHSPVPVLVTRSRRLGRLDRVLVPVDFDDGSRAALDVATGLFPPATAIHAFHAVAPIAVIHPGFPLKLPSEAAVIRELQEFLESAGAGRARCRAAVNEDPGAAILRYARSWNADLIVISTHGRRGLTRVLLGSVAERVARHADRPVLILPPRPARAIALPERAFMAETAPSNGKRARSLDAIP